MTRSIALKELTSLDVERQLFVRDIRNSPAVRAWMYTDHEISLNEHLGWIARLKTDRKQIVFAVLENEAPIGVASVNALDRLHQRADLGWYLDESARGGMGTAIAFAIVRFAFGPLGLQKLNAEVIEGNDRSVKFHENLGFKREGFREANILKNGKRIGAHFLGLRADQWDEPGFLARYGDKLESFAVTVAWQEPGPLEPIDQIEAARAKNNVNWMNILRIALEKSPQTAGPVVAEIRALDKEITGLTHELVSRLNT